MVEFYHDVKEKDQMEGADAAQKSTIPIEHDRLKRIEDLTSQLESAIDYLQQKIGPITAPDDTTIRADVAEVPSTTFDGIIDRLDWQIDRVKNLNTRIRL